VALCTLLLGTAGWLIGLPPTAAFIVGFGLSLSSTPLVLQVLPSAVTQNAARAARRSGSCCSRILAVLPVLAVLPLISPAIHNSIARRPLVADPVQTARGDCGGHHRRGGGCCYGPRYASSRACGSQRYLRQQRCSRSSQPRCSPIRPACRCRWAPFWAGVLLADSEFRHELERTSSRSRDCCSACSHRRRHVRHLGLTHLAAAHGDRGSRRDFSRSSSSRLRCSRT